MNLDHWPFNPVEQEEQDRWWAECYTSRPSAITLLYQPYWSVLFGGALSGKTTVLNWVQHQLADTSLVINYSPESWPKTGDPPETNHLTRMMRLAAEQVRSRIIAEPSYLLNLSFTQKEYLRWLFEKFIHPRAFIRMIDSLSPSFPSLEDEFRTIAPPDLYPTQTDGDDVEGQIEELLTLCHKLHKTQIIYFIDINGMLSPPQINKLEELFQWQALKHHNGLYGIIAMTEREKTADHWLNLARGRVNPVRLSCNQELSLAIADKHIDLATAGSVKQVQDLLTQDQFSKLRQIIQVEFQEQPVGAWVALAQLFIEKLETTGFPMDSQSITNVCRDFFYRHLKIYIDPKSAHPGVWRGNRFIALDPGPFDLLSKMVIKHGEPVFHYDISQKKVNMHTLVHRIREQIEPRFDFTFLQQSEPKQRKQDQTPIYLHNRKSYGYWLEHYIDLSGL
jgi:hypothetical protein